MRHFSKEKQKELKNVGHVTGYALYFSLFYVIVINRIPGKDLSTCLFCSMVSYNFRGCSTVLPIYFLGW